MTARRRRRAVGMIAGLLTVGVAAAGCGLAEDAEPREIAAGDLPPALIEPNPTASTTVPGATRPATVYFLAREGDTTRLAEVERPVADPSDPVQRLTALLNAEATSDEQADGLTTAIPQTTNLLDTDLSNDGAELTIDLSEGIFGLVGEELANAFAQIVFTVTGDGGVRRVRFLVEGDPRNAQISSGEQKEIVSRADYRSLNPET